jgi:hypothetical protein
MAARRRFPSRSALAAALKRFSTRRSMVIAQKPGSQSPFPPRLSLRGRAGTVSRVAGFDAVGGRSGAPGHRLRTLHSTGPRLNHGDDGQLPDNGSPGASAGARGIRILILYRVRTNRRAREARWGPPCATSASGDRKLG